jgi:hypothetical protein
MFEDIKRDIQAKTEEFEKQLIEQAVRTASNYYSNALYAGDNDAKVISKGNEVIAEGSSPMFIEFGTGILKLDAPEARQEIESSNGLVSHGHYGEGRARSIKGWYYKDKPMNGAQPPDDEPATNKSGLRHTWGNDATPAMYFARKETIERAGEIGKKVFK